MSNVDNQKNANKRIAKNTAIVYGKLVVTTIIGLLSSRYVLQALGVDDFGLYNVVGSVIGLFAFISASLSVTTIRFLNFEKGKFHGDMNRMFNICNTLHILLALFLLVIFEAFGIWYIENHLNVEPGKMSDAMFVFQVSTIACCLGVMNVPYSSLYNVHERFLFPAVLEVVNSVLKLLCIFLLLYYSGNRLRMYALVMALLTVCSFVIFHILAYRNWSSIVRWAFVSGWASYREVVSFANFNMLSTVSMTARSQGSNLLINFFFGTVVNAAYAIASTVRAFVETFMASFDGAAAPQITQNISGGNFERASYLANKICRLCIVLSELIILPVYVELDFLLKLWIGIPPEGTALFCRIMLMVVLVAATSGGINQIINGSGKVKWFKIELSFFYILCLPVGYLLFTNGYPAYYILILFIISDILSRITQFALLKLILSYDVVSFIKEAYWRPFLIMVLMALFVIFYRYLDLQSNQMRVVGIALATIYSVALTFVVGLKKNEKNRVLEQIRIRLRKI
ncbi:oligosaccharide flippase family protein [Methanobrevibacter sp.]|uniref:oligosaccharide flippase family protein n=1 Tax=Methanobrevibacter sp. TaxID=66852 RepID=UPI003865E173